LLTGAEFARQGAAGDKGQLGATAGHGDGGAEGDAATRGGAEGDQAGADLVRAAVVGRERESAISQWLLAGAGQGDTTRYEQDQFVAADRAGDRAAGEDHLVGDGDEGGVHGALGNECGELPAVVDLLLEVDVGEFGVEDREEDRGEADEGADDQALAGRGRAGGGVHLVEVAEDVLSPAGQFGAGRSRASAAGVAEEELGAAAAFQPGQALRRRGLGDAEFPGGGADGAGAADGSDQLEIFDRW
jgi:hypothetical protein